MLDNERLLPVETLREMVRLDERGRLIWLERPLSHFCRDKEMRRWNSRYAGTEALGTPTEEGYKRGKINALRYWAHRVVWALHTGEWPQEHIDHIDGHTANNRPSNLRDVPESDNFKNQKRRSSNTSGVMGVTWRADRSRWVARVSDGRGSRKIVGMFASFDDAVRARKLAEEQHDYHRNHGR
jgi:hypothetical protein